MQSTPETPPIRVLFVCLGNICRSPMAEAVFADMVRQANLQGRIQADSAGTYHGHAGSGAHPGTLGILEEKGIAYEGVSRGLVAEDLGAFDYVVTMDDQNARAVARLGRDVPGHRAEVRPLLSYALEDSAVRANAKREVPDPYYEGGFDGVFAMVSEGCAGLLHHIREEHGI